MNVIKIARNEIKQNEKYLYLVYLVTFLTMIPQITISIVSSNFNQLIFLVFGSFAIVLFSNFSKILFSAFIIYINLTNVIFMNIFIHWGYKSDTDILPRIEVSMVSPIYEKMEYLKSFVDYRDILFVLYTFLIFWLLYKLNRYKNSFNIMKIISLILILLIGIKIAYYDYLPLKEMEPFSLIVQYAQAKQDCKLYTKRSKYLNDISRQIFTNHSKGIYDKIIIVQGESVNKHHMSIYGYSIPTTPFLSYLKARNKLYIFNAISPANQTRYSLAIFYTKANVRNFNRFFNSPSIISDFRFFGYKTYWLSNQGLVGQYDSSIVSIAKEADINIFENIDFQTAKLDKVLLVRIKKIPINSNKELYFIHLMGSHFEYEKRYDNKHILFQNPTIVTQKYDNSIKYTDYILREIYNYFTTKYGNQKILFIYLSDHGEVVNEKMHGHGFLPSYKDEYEIPLVIYSNIKNSRIDELYKDNQKGYFNLENLNYIIEYISFVSDKNNISYSSYVLSLDPKNIFDYNQLSFFQ